MRLKALAGALLLASFPLIAASAEEGGRYSFLSFSFLPLPFLEGNGGPEVETSASINVLAGERAGLKGGELGIALNLERGSVRGAQFGGLGNIVQGPVSGAQFSFCANLAGGPLKGVQLGGLYNRASSVSGLQFGFALNQTAGELRGLQLGLVNIAGKSRGLQLGLVNIAREGGGLAFGLVSIEKGGIFEPLARVEAPLLSPARVGLGLKLGGRRSYTILLASMPPSEPGRCCVDLGWGLRLSASALLADLDLSWRTEETASFTAGKEERLRGSALARGEIRPRGLPLALGISVELLIPGVSSEDDGGLAASPRLRPALFLDLGPL